MLSKKKEMPIHYYFSFVDTRLRLQKKSNFPWTRVVSVRRTSIFKTRNITEIYPQFKPKMKTKLSKQIETN